MSAFEWLLSLTETRDGYDSLVREAGSLERAAWHLARAKCEAFERSTHVPSQSEVRAAASYLVSQLRLPVSVPPGAALKAACESHGLPVL
jgi:hypothetical protein